MKKILIICMAAAFLYACSSRQRVHTLASFSLTEVSSDPTYGYTEVNHIQVGGADEMSGPTNERRYLAALAGPHGEAISYYREGSCCPVKSENGFNGLAMLDIYKVTWKGSKDTVTLYINMYDRGELKAPKGFTIR